LPKNFKEPSDPEPSNPEPSNPEPSDPEPSDPDSEKVLKAGGGKFGSATWG
jgi:hypothetical protein